MHSEIIRQRMLDVKEICITSHNEKYLQLNTFIWNVLFFIYG